MLNYLKRKLRKTNILFVDDDEMFLELVEDVFKDKIKYLVETAENGKIAIEKLTNCKNFDIVVTDISMPQYDGFWLMQKMIELCIKKPVITISALSEMDHSVRSHKLGAKIYLAKPFDFNELIKEIENILNFSPYRNEEMYQVKSLFNAANGKIDQFLEEHKNHLSTEIGTRTKIKKVSS